MTAAQRISTIALLAVATFALQARGDYRDDSRAVDVSGGEDHTLVLTKDKSAWACGSNGCFTFRQYRYGVLGTENTSWSHFETTLVRVYDGAMGTESERLENINDVAADGGGEYQAYQATIAEALGRSEVTWCRTNDLKSVDLDKYDVVLLASGLGGVLPTAGGNRV